MKTSASRIFDQRWSSTRRGAESRVDAVLPALRPPQQPRRMPSAAVTAGGAMLRCYDRPRPPGKQTPRFPFRLEPAFVPQSAGRSARAAIRLLGRLQAIHPRRRSTPRGISCQVAPEPSIAGGWGTKPPPQSCRQGPGLLLLVLSARFVHVDHRRCSLRGFVFLHRRPLGGSRGQPLAHYRVRCRQHHSNRPQERVVSPTGSSARVHSATRSRW